MKRWLKLGVPAAVLLAGGAALAGVPNTFKDGDLLSAQAMNANFASLDTRLATIESLVGSDGGATNVATWHDSKNAFVPIVETARYGVIGGDMPIYNFYDRPSQAIWQYSNGNTNWTSGIVAPFRTHVIRHNSRSRESDWMSCSPKPSSTPTKHRARPH